MHLKSRWKILGKKPSNAWRLHSMKWIIFIEPRHKERHWLRMNSSSRRRAHSLLACHTLNCVVYVTWKFCIFTSLFGRHGSVSHCLHHMFSPWYMLWLLTSRASERNKTNLQTEFGQSQRQQSLNWTCSKLGKKTEAYKNAFCLNQRLKPRHLCPEVLVHGSSLIPTYTKPTGQVRLAIGSCASDNQATTCLASAFKCLSPWSLKSSNRFPHPWQCWCFKLCSHSRHTASVTHSIILLIASTIVSTAQRWYAWQ